MFLGVDVSTQSLTGVVIDVDRGAVVERISLPYDACFPRYRTFGGLLAHADPAVRHTNPVMWIEALSVVLARVGAGRWGPQLQGIGVAAQQRGTVYLSADRTWDLTATPREWGRSLARLTAPTWMDSSALTECAELEDACGGGAAMNARVGSVPTPRSSAPQIRKYLREDPEGYARTDLVLLPSAYVTGFLIGSDAPAEWGDAASTCLLDVERRAWSQDVAGLTAPGLLERLPGLAEPASVIGTLPFNTARSFGLPADVRVVVGTGDNLGSAVALGINTLGRFAASLGTSHTLFGQTTPDQRDPAGAGSVLPTRDGMLGITVLRNGGLVLDALLRQLGSTHTELDDLLLKEPAPDRSLILPFVLPEIAPAIGPVGLRLVGPKNPWTVPQLLGGLVEAQILRLRIHSDWLGTPQEIMVTGGASKSDAYAQMIADIFGVPARRLTLGDSAALGAAINAAAGWAEESAAEVANRFLAGQASVTVEPRLNTRQRYAEQLERYRQASSDCVIAAAVGGQLPGVAYPLTL